MSIQAPPNLQPGGLTQLIRAGINDWGGVSPVTPDHVNPEAPWPHLLALEHQTRAAGRVLLERLALTPGYASQPERWTDPTHTPRVRRATDSRGFARSDRWYAGSGAELPPGAARWAASTASAVAGASPSSRAKVTRLASRLANDLNPCDRPYRPAPERIRYRASLQRQRRRPRPSHPGRRHPPPRHRGRHRDLRRQPQYQLHQHLQLQVRLLRLLQGPRVCRSARPRLQPRPGGNRATYE